MLSSRYVFLFMIIFACGCGSCFAQQPLGGVEPLLPDCKALQESSQRTETTLRNMLAEVRQRLGDVEKLKRAVGPDALDDARQLLADQESRLVGMLRDLSSVECGSPAR
jgi:hypothetical protein